MITVWGRRSSSNVQALMWCLEELGLAYQRINAGFTYGVIDSPDYLAMNPNGTVPMIRDGSHPPLWETGAILRYLADQYADDDFWPADPIQRARVDQCAEWVKINVAMMFTFPIFWRVARTPVEQQDLQLIQAAVLEFESALAIAERQLEQHPYLAGPNFTLADIQFAHVLYRYYDIGIERRPMSVIADYYKRIERRNAYTAHVSISYDELVGTK